MNSVQRRWVLWSSLVAGTAVVSAGLKFWPHDRSSSSRRTAPTPASSSTNVSRPPLPDSAPDAKPAAGEPVSISNGQPPGTSDEPSGASDAQPPVTTEALREEAYGLAEKVLLDFPEDTGPLVLMARLHHQFGDRAQAVDWWQKALNRSLEGPAADGRMAAAAYTRMGVIAADRGDYARALDLFRNARQLDPGQRGVHLRIGHALLQLGQPEDAVQALEEEVRRHPNFETPYRTLGQAHLELQQLEKAFSYYEKAVALVPEDTQSYYGLTVACSRLGWKAKALAYGEKFRQLKAMDDKLLEGERSTFSDTDWMRRAVAPLFRHAGEIYLEHQRTGEAEQHLKRAADLDPNDRLCRQTLVDVYMRQRRYADAVPLCQQLRTIDPHVANYHLNAGVVLAILKQFPAAEDALRAGIALDPDRPDGYYSLVQVLLQGTGKFADAKAMAEKLVELEPKAKHYYLLCVASEANNDIPGAWAAIERASELAPDDDRIRRAREQLRRRATERRRQGEGVENGTTGAGTPGHYMGLRDHGKSVVSRSPDRLTGRTVGLP